MSDSGDSDDLSGEDEAMFEMAMGDVNNPKGHAHAVSGDSQAGDEIPRYEKPNYAAAMEYWNTLLPRRIKDPSQPSGYRQALAGELYDENGEPAQLYDFFKTDSAALDEFGIGMSLYFRSLKMMGVVCFVCALILLVSAGENKKNQVNVSFFSIVGIEDVKDSIGTCEVSYDSITDHYVFDRNTSDTRLKTTFNLLGSAYGATPSSLQFSKQGVADLIIFSIFLLTMILANRLEKQEVEAIDIAQQTTQDYSVVVKNPPPDCASEELYHKFFSKFGEVVTLTVALKNGGLMKAIADRKMLSMKVDAMRQQRALTPPEVLARPETFGARVAKFLKMDLESSEAKLKKMDDQILAMSMVDYVPWRVFVSFNKEDEQRRCLEDLAIDFKFFKFLNLDTVQPESLKFEGHALIVTEAPEPTDVIYDHCHRTKVEVLVRLVISYSITALAIFGVMYIITVLQNVEGTAAQLSVALFISGMNAGLPVFIRMLTQIVEAHSSETGSQRSVLTKLLIARCVNSAVLIKVLTPWHSQFSLENMRQIQVILLSDALIGPFIRFLNVWDVFKRRFIGPVVFGKTQAGYNSQFQGTKWTLAERYSDALKSVFAGFFFAVPLPTGLFISSFTMMSTYMVDKYSLMRLWERKPTIDHSLAKLSRYFLIATLWTHLFISLNYFANWPYSYGGLPKEDSCDANCEECPVRVDEIECDVFIFFCGPDRDYMTASQYKTVLVFLVLSLTIGALIVFFFLFFRTTKKLVKRMIGKVKETGDASDIPLREVFGAPAYVPTIKLKQMTAPFVFSDIAKLPVRFSPIRQNVGWAETVDTKEFSLVDPLFYPQVSDVHFKGMFSTTSFYEAKEQIANTSAAYGSDSDENSDIDDEEATEKTGFAREITEEEFESSSFVPTDDLPSGWERRITDAGRIFHVDHNSMIITTEDPPRKANNDDAGSDNGSGTSEPSAKFNLYSASKSMNSFDLSKNISSRSMTRTAGLPEGWELKMTAKGKSYYVDHNSQETHWELPTVNGGGSSA